MTWPNTGDTAKEIPDKYLRLLADMLALELGPYFGKPIDRLAPLADAARRKLQHLTTNRWTPQTTPTEFM